MVDDHIHQRTSFPVQVSVFSLPLESLAIAAATIIFIYLEGEIF